MWIFAVLNLCISHADGTWISHLDGPCLDGQDVLLQRPPHGEVEWCPTACRIKLRGFLLERIAREVAQLWCRSWYHVAQLKLSIVQLSVIWSQRPNGYYCLSLHRRGTCLCYSTQSIMEILHIIVVLLILQVKSWFQQCFAYIYSKMVWGRSHWETSIWLRLLFSFLFPHQFTGKELYQPVNVHFFDLRGATLRSFEFSDDQVQSLNASSCFIVMEEIPCSSRDTYLQIYTGTYIYIYTHFNIHIIYIFPYYTTLLWEGYDIFFISHTYRFFPGASRKMCCNSLVPQVGSAIFHRFFGGGGFRSLKIARLFIGSWNTLGLVKIDGRFSHIINELYSPDLTHMTK